ncbi:MAG: AtpZ/AtpI family protein [Calditrichia bacterium]|nr:AtpZ/AtpI family protein [Calditrichota bacterium]MCB0267140.1 AtpZ/AtpI family protein [Calditrichota bacterium]MCB0287379.1 AtpZ/AtpI family protein [Calditrichota bacterium]MCB9066411.1 AtpZ/AtpI family protein [Calditrichia bacterium]
MMSANNDGGAPVKNTDKSYRKRGKKSFVEVLREAAPLLHFGWTLVTLIVVFAYLGNYLDGKWETGPWMMLAGLIFAIIAGFYIFFKLVSKFNQNTSKR